MAQHRFQTTTDAVLILDAGPDGGFVNLEVLDASTLFFDGSKDTLLSAGSGIATNTVQGFQLKSTNGIFGTWWTGQMFGRSDTVGGTIYAAVVYKKRKCGCSGGARGGAINNSGAPQPQFQES